MIAAPLASLFGAIFLFGFALFHAALAMGAPWAAFSWGGQAKAGPLPARLQMGSTILAPFIAAMGLLLLIRGGWIYPDLASTLFWPVWAIFLFVVTQMFGALRSESRAERRYMTPAYAIAAVLCASLAFVGM